MHGGYANASTLRTPVGVDEARIKAFASARDAIAYSLKTEAVVLKGIIASAGT